MIRRLVAPAALVAALGTGPSPAEPGALEGRILAARDRVFPALVHVEPILEVFRGGERGRVAATGSGVIISADGLVLTNAHVIEDAQRVTCVLWDRREIAAEVVGRDEATDLAVLRLDAAALDDGPLPVAELGRSASLEPGQWVMAMGSPLGLARSMSLGIVSSRDRYLPEGRMPGGEETGLYNTWVQTDAAINPGNSGGPLVDLDGRVVGINARAVTVFGENVGFAIPADVVREVLPELVEKGKVGRSYTGLHLQSLRALPEARRRETPAGVVVGGVDDGSPAAEAGVLTGDVVLSWDGEPTEARFDDQLPAIRKRMAADPAGRAVAVGIWRAGERRDLVLTPAAGTFGAGEQLDAREWGFTVRGVTTQLARDRNLVDETGVIVTGVKNDSFAREAGLGQWTVIVRLDEKPVQDLADFAEIYRAAVDRRATKVLVETRSGVVHNWHVLRPVYERNDDDRP